MGVDWGDKILHFSAYFAFGLTIALGLKTTNISGKKFIVSLFSIGFIYGLSDEIHQYFIPGRDADILDWAADCLGIILSYFLFLGINRVILNKKNAGPANE